MEKRSMKSQTLYPFFSFVSFSIAILLSFIIFFKDHSLLVILLVIFLLMGMIFYIYHTKHIQSLLLELIHNTTNIIDQKENMSTIIDGESYIAVLSDHLSILDTRMKGMIETLQKEQGLLKNYIEDISHQIKTPLTSMILREEMLLEMMLPSQEKEILIHIYQQTEKIKDLIESLLHLAQIESHSIEYHKKEYNLEEMIQHIHELLLPLLEENNVHINTANLNTFIYCDEKWMSEAFEKIIKNCIEQRRNACIDIYCENHSSYTEIYIQDQGHGFDKEDILHLFDRFYQGKTHKGKGVGIGLAMSKGIIEGHHGHIEAMNHQGALFKITVPHKITKSKVIVTKE